MQKMLGLIVVLAWLGCACMAQVNPAVMVNVAKTVRPLLPVFFFFWEGRGERREKLRK